MPKSSADQIEKDERKILNELLKNANKSINEIAQTLGFSRQKVWRVIKNMEKNHTIWGYTVVLDSEKLNKKTYMMLIKRTIKPVTKKLIDDITTRNFADEVKEKEIDITCSLFAHGYYDWVVCFNAKAIKEAKWFVEYFNRLYEGFISDIHLIDIMFSTVRSGVKNPEIEKLEDFFEI